MWHSTNKLYGNAIAGLLVVMLTVQLFAETAQDELEEALSHGFGGVDVISDTISPAPYVPHRYRNAIPEFQWFLDKNGWTTNQLVEGLICAITNNVGEENWSVRRKQRTARVAARKLSEIDVPAVTNFFRRFNGSDNTSKLKCITIPATFRRTNLEPEVMAYMRTLCVSTNVYSKSEYEVFKSMKETLNTMPEELKLSATNRVASFMYYSVLNTTQDIAWQDKELAKFVPAYSNSVQRLSALRHVAATTENWRTRAIVQKEVERLSSLPTNQLNNISWIAEDVTGGK